LQIGIVLAAFDFDATILDFHTEVNGREMSKFLVRPVFKCYISLCLEKGIRVAVATFSTQTEMIAKVLEEAIPHSRAKDTVVFGGDDHEDTERKAEPALLGDGYFQQAASYISR
jgi:hypothetical protein